MHYVHEMQALEKRRGGKNNDVSLVLQKVWPLKVYPDLNSRVPSE
jgi:hypothetical protein